MAKYISAVELADEISRRCSIPVADLVDIFGAIPAADVEPVRHRRWKQFFEDWREQIEGDKCSICGFEHYGPHYHYCPNCGAKIDLEGEE